MVSGSGWSLWVWLAGGGNYTGADPGLSVGGL